MPAATTREEEQFYCMCLFWVSGEYAVVNYKWYIQKLFPFFLIGEILVYFHLQLKVTNSGDGICFAVVEILSICWLNSVF